MIGRIAPTFLGLAIFFLSGCDKPGRVIGETHNQWPETELTYGPSESTTTVYRVHLYWYGYDRDGEVVRYRFGIDSDTLRPPSKWHTTTAKDSVFIFRVATGELVGRHAFWILAEDNDGRFDPTPAKRSLSVRTQPPSAWFTDGPGNFQYTGFDVSYSWTGSDPDGSGYLNPSLPDSFLRVSVPDSFEYLLLFPGRAVVDGHAALPAFSSGVYESLIHEARGASLQPPYDDWKWAGTAGRVHQFASLPLGPVAVAVRAVDTAGAKDTLFTFGRNFRTFTVGTRSVLP